MALLSALFLLLPLVSAVERVYYIGITEEIWDYAPSGYNLITGVLLDSDPDARVFYQNASDRIGGRYKKALYYEYGDATFSTKKPKDPKLGFLGPTIIGEVGDVITIHAKNFASHNFSLHPHGVQYLKKSEGAVYVDGTPQEEKYIAPNMTHTYTWNMHAEYGPTDNDPNCSTYMYHSHVDTIKDTYSGLLGAMLVCREGSLKDGERTDVNKNFVLNFYVVDENLSWYIDDNIELFLNDTVDKDDPDFQESNTMHAINGLGYGNLQGLNACEGETIGWNLIGFGNEVDIHSAQFEKQTVIVSQHRQDTIKLFAAVFKSVTMVAANPGESVISCRVNDHYSAGMLTSLNVSSACGSSVATGNMNATTKNYYIVIEETDWNYGPSGTNLMTGQDLTADGTDSSTFFLEGPTTIGGTYKKAIFVGYEDAAFTNRTTTKNEMGILGPLIAVEIGDVINVTLQNNASLPFNIEPHGLQLSDTIAVQPGETHTFTWTAPDSVAPGSADPDCISYLYTSSVDPVKDTNSGLVGPLLVCRRGTLADAQKRDAYYLLFSVLDENQSHYLKANIDAMPSTGVVDEEDEDFQESNLMHSINGLMYGNLQNISLCVGRETDFHVIGLGTEVDMHSMFASGVNIRVRKENTQVASVFPQTTATTTVVPTSAGNGEIKCVVVDHLSGGMLTSYSVSGNCEDVTQSSSGVTREYFIGVEEEDWDYVNGRTIDTFGNSFNDPDTPGYTFVHQEYGKFIGSVYKKVIYQQYDGSDFMNKLSKKQNLGLLGPVIGGEAGDTIKITLKNKVSALPRNYSITPWGAKDINDPFNYNTSGISPGETKVYEWIVPDNAVPPDGQPGCNAWLYRSNVDEIKDAYSGLLGPLLLCRKGSFNGGGGTNSYQEDFYLLFLVFDENQSHYIDYNIKNFAQTDPTGSLKEDPEFQESNLMHGINGQIYGLGGLKTTRNDEVLWHLMGYGNEVDIHTVHFHAHAFTYRSDVTINDDVFSLFPGKIGTVQMRTTEPGTWLMHCHVDDHIQAGMVTTFTVTDSAQSIGQSAWQMALLVVMSKSLTSLVSS